MQLFGKDIVSSCNCCSWCCDKFSSVLSVLDFSALVSAFHHFTLKHCLYSLRTDDVLRCVKSISY